MGKQIGVSGQQAEERKQPNIAAFFLAYQGTSQRKLLEGLGVVICGNVRYLGRSPLLPIFVSKGQGRRP
jgi:hypothetical protein